MAAYGVVGFVVLGIVSGTVFCIYKAAELRHFAKCTRFEGLAFELNATIGGLMWLVIGNTHFVADARLRRCLHTNANGSFAIGWRHAGPSISTPSSKAPIKDRIWRGLADAFDVGAI